MAPYPQQRPILLTPAAYLKFPEKHSSELHQFSGSPLSNRRR